MAAKTREQVEQETQAIRKFAKDNQIKRLPYKCRACSGMGYLPYTDNLFGDYTAKCKSCDGIGWKSSI